MRTLALVFAASAIVLLVTPMGSAFAACARDDLACRSGGSGQSYSGAPGPIIGGYSGAPGPIIGGYSGAPGPIIGAGLPALGIIGGVYYALRRRRSNKA
jgi:uncharacterized membrane protein